MKMINFPKNKRLSTTIVLFSVAVLFILNTISAIFMCLLTGHGMNQKQDAFLHQTTANAKQQVEEFIGEYINLTEFLSLDSRIKNLIQSGSTLTPMSSVPGFQDVIFTLQSAMEQYPEILGIGFGSILEDNIYTQEGRSLNIALTERPYFSTASEDTYVSPPYIDTVTDELCVSIASPVGDNKTAGLLILDLKLDHISDFVAQMAFGTSGRIALLSSDNTIISYSDPSLIGENFNTLNLSKRLERELSDPSKTVFRYHLNGESRIGIMEELGGRWKVLSAMSEREYNSQTVRTILSLILLLLLGTVIVAVFLYTIVSRKLHPIAEINEGLKEMSEGNLHVDVNYNGNDEIGEMADSLRSCLFSLSSYVDEIDSVMKQLADGDLTVKSNVEFAGDFLPIQNSIFTFVRNLTELVQGIYQSSEQVSSGAEQVSSGAQSLAQGATEQTSSVEELASTLSELSTAVKSNSEMAQIASENATQVNNEIIESSEKMNHSLDLMEEIRSSTDRVGGIIKTIEDIAFQTNILALNAAVEAARAGQAGKGFAVVAEEVRNLAGKSADASKATTELISSMVSSIENGSASMEQTKQYMDHVVQAAAEITEVFHKISYASQKQAESIAQVVSGTDQISSVVQSNSATAQESAAASEELSGQSQMLKNMVGRFKMDEQ